MWTFGRLGRQQKTWRLSPMRSADAGIVSRCTVLSRWGFGGELRAKRIAGVTGYRCMESFFALKKH